MPPLTLRLLRGLSAGGGDLLSLGTRALAAVRPAAKPLHPEGSLHSGALLRSGAAVEDLSGVAWLDEPGRDSVLVRSSRAVGLPGPLPDVHGLALRIHREPGTGDLLLATTGQGLLTRFLLSPARSPHRRAMTTLLPYRSPSGPVLIGAVVGSGGAVALSWARLTGPWHRFGEIVLDADPATGPDQDVSFDPVVHQVPGLECYGWVRRLREPAYRTARHTRLRRRSLPARDPSAAS